MFTCPQCDLQLHRIKTDVGVLWSCERCSGRAVNVSLLRKHVQRGFINTFWQAVRNAPASRRSQPRKCPACAGAMAEIAHPGITSTMVLDVCKRCQFVWFDKDETQELPIAPPKPKTKPAEPSPKAREALAMVKVRKIAEEARGSALDATPPDQWWQVLAGFFGMPIEDEPPPLSRMALLTWGMAFLILAMSLYSFTDMERIVATYGLLPSDAWRMEGLTFLTSFFIHGGILHLVGNVYFFLIFGDNVEDYLGQTRFIILLVLATLVGGLLHVALSPRPEVPCIGASGGISGIMVFYALAFPHVRLMVAWRYLFHLMHWFRFTALTALVLWIAIQLFGVWSQMNGFSNVSALAHLGGAATGLVLWLIWRKPLEGRTP